METDFFGTEGRPDAAGPEARLADALAIVGLKTGEAGTVAIDDYIRFSFETAAGTAGTGTVAIEDGDIALVEIGIDLATGRLRGATLVSFARRARALPFSLADLAVKTGLPVLGSPAFDRDDPVPRIVRRGAIDLWHGPGAGLVQIADGRPDCLIRAGEAIFLADGDRLWGFGADRLDAGRLSAMTG